jgi:glutamate synthase (NADPH/NADH) large chain
MPYTHRPEAYGLYDPAFEKENCGVGFVAHIKGEQSRQIVQMGRAILENMEHRGALGSEKNTGDGAGILTAFPRKFMARVFAEMLLPYHADRGSVPYASGLFFLPREEERKKECKEAFADACREENLILGGWRKVPYDDSMLGDTAKASMPAIEQPLVIAPRGMDAKDFERTLFVARKMATHRIRGGAWDPERFFYICSLSSKVMVYKGMLTTAQLFAFFPDLSEPDFESHVAMVHSRFSTNTFPSWDRAQPLRFMAHNGEINTLRGNVNKMRGRQGSLVSNLFGDSLKKAFPVIEPDLSDSGCFDNCLELLYLGGRSLPESAMMMVPEAWQNAKHMDPVKRAFYEYHSCLMEPWDGPASITFTDGVYIGALLDRNGLRPSRYYVTRDDLVVMASEVGVLKLDPASVIKKGRLEPGRMFLVNFEEGRIVDDGELKMRVSAARPYGEWLKQESIRLHDIETSGAREIVDPSSLIERLKAFGYTSEHLHLILKPMALEKQEPLGSMGNDAALAVLSAKSRLAFDYFKQLFAQVTNPPIDSIREAVVMSLESYIGPSGNLLDSTKEHCRMLKVPNPILTDEQLWAIKHMDHRGWTSKTIDCCFARTDGEAGLQKALDRIEAEALKAVQEGRCLMILSDRAASESNVPVPSLLALGAVHQRLLREGLRTKIGIVVESGEPREVHHFCMLVGYGADAVNPYLAFEAMAKLRDDGYLPAALKDSKIEENYIAAISKGMRKVFGKMGISTLDSYKGAQIFECVGLSAEVIGRCFEGTPSRIGGAGFDDLGKEALMRHSLAWPSRNLPVGTARSLPSRGEYKWRQGGERHMWDPESVANLQHAVRFEDRAAFKRFSDRQNQRSTEQCTLRGLLSIKKGQPIPIEEVEPVEAIMRRFVTGAMSFGSISQEAHEALAVAMNRIGGKSNTGEGGERPERFRVLGNGDSKRSAIKQVASGRFGVTAEYLTNADEIQIKMAQGAKPGEGGELPGHKVFDIIAKTRHSTAGVGLISPPPHHDIYSIEDLAQLIFDLKNANPRARVSVKLVSEVGVGTVAAGVAKAHADHILISGHDGGTGASPLTGIKHAGLPWELGLAETHQCLVMNDLRSRVVVQTDGQIKTARDVAIAAMLGAEEFGVATAALIALGCIMMRKCEKNTCPVGIATQDPVLRERFAGKPEYVERLFRYISEDLRAILAELGLRSVDELVGRVDLLEADMAVRFWKSQGLDLSPIIAEPRKPRPDVGTRCLIKQDHGLDAVLDRKLIALAEPALRRKEAVRIELPVENTDRSIATMLSHEITRLYGARGLPDGTIKIKLKGSAGQSFGAFMTRGVSLEIEGDLNDYVGKGLCGGLIVAYPPKESRFRAEDNILLGNVAFYGATSGKAFLRGRAAERFCVRNSGAEVVVEGTGDHGCEYMTGGRAIILGPVGRNFAAGMSGGIAYVYDPAGDLEHLCNREMVGIERVADPEEAAYLHDMVAEHRDRTGSTLAASLLKVWPKTMEGFARVMPHDYKKALEKKKLAAMEAK